MRGSCERLLPKSCVFTWKPSEGMNSVLGHTCTSFETWEITTTFSSKSIQGQKSKTLRMLIVLKRTCSWGRACHISLIEPKQACSKNLCPNKKNVQKAHIEFFLLLLLVLEKVLLIYTKNFQWEFSLIKGTTLLEWFKRPGPVRKNEKLNLMEEDTKYQPLLGGYCIFVKRRRFGSAIKKDPLFPFYHNERPTLICKMLLGIFSGLFVLATCFFSAEGIAFLPLLLSCMLCVLV